MRDIKDTEVQKSKKLGAKFESCRLFRIRICRFPKNFFWSKIFFCRKNFLGSKKIFGLKKIFGGKNFLFQKVF